MDRYEKLFLGIVLGAFLFDVVTLLISYLLGVGGSEANILKALFGDVGLVAAILLSFVIVFVLHRLLTRTATNNFQRGFILIITANAVFAKIAASLSNIYISLNATEYKEVVYSSDALVTNYLLFIFFILLSPIFLNLLFFWLYWKMYGEKAGG